MNVQYKLLDWYLNNQRILPFRENQDPYRIWVSEIMLQQTRVDTVIPFYNRFMEKFPTMFDLAKASEDEVFKLWEGLGYYSRARNLLKCSKVLVETYEGRFPKDYKKVLKLPGIGPYTAGAVLSIAYNMKVPAVDGNVMRVMSRVYNSREDIAKAKTKKIIEEKVLEIIPEDARNFNQAIMELGAMVCTPQNPKCDQCPVSEECICNSLGLQKQLPVKSKKIVNKKVKVAIGVIKKNDKILLVKNNEGLLKGLWGFPITEGISKSDALSHLANILQKDQGMSIQNIHELGEAKHVFTHKTWLMTGYEIRIIEEESPIEKITENVGECLIVDKMLKVAEEKLQYVQERVWIREEELSDYAISTAHRKLLQYL